MTHKERYKFFYKPVYNEWIKLYPFTLDDLDGEEWRDIVGYDGVYQESNFGRTKSFQYKTPRIVRPQVADGGYLQVGLSKNGKRKTQNVHQLVANLFIPNPDNLPEIDHRFGVKFDNYAGNLRWVTSSENKKYAAELGLTKQGEDRTDSYLTNEQVEWCRKVYKPRDREFSAKALAEKLGVNAYVVRLAIHGHTYKNAGGNVHDTDSKILSVDTQAQIKKEYRRGVQGCGYSALAKKYGVSSTTIKRIVIER